MLDRIGPDTKLAFSGAGPISQGNGLIAPCDPTLLNMYHSLWGLQLCCRPRLAVHCDEAWDCPHGTIHDWGLVTELLTQTFRTLAQNCCAGIRCAVKKTRHHSTRSPTRGNAQTRLDLKQRLCNAAYAQACLHAAYAQARLHAGPARDARPFQVNPPQCASHAKGALKGGNLKGAGPHAWPCHRARRTRRCPRYAQQSTTCDANIMISMLRQGDPPGPGSAA